MRGAKIVVVAIDERALNELIAGLNRYGVVEPEIQIFVEIADPGPGKDGNTCSLHADRRDPLRHRIS